MNLYVVSNGNEWCYFVFAESPNKARAMCVNHMCDERYIDLKAYLRADKVGGLPAVIDCPDDEDYGRVTILGFGYQQEVQDE